MGRFLSEDPIRLGGGINFYTYALNSPVNLGDPLGENAGAIALPISEGIGGVLCFGSGACETAILAGGIVIAVGATAALIYEIAKDHCDKRKNCAPCVPPVGTIGYRLDIVPPSGPHYPYTGTHWHLYRMNQNPNNCQCFWDNLHQVGEGPTPPGAVPFTPAGGGGPL